MSKARFERSQNSLPCPLCGYNGNVSFRILKNGYHIYRCDDCNLMFVHPQPSPDELLRIYDNSYFSRGNKYLRMDETESQSRNLDNDKQKINIIKKYKENGMLLDVGCAMGEFLYLARQEGFDVAGVEVSTLCTDYVKNKLGIDIHSGDLLSAHLPSNMYDVVTLWDVIEHLRNPVEIINELYRILRPGGILCFSTGDVESFYAHIMGRFWHLLTPPQHLFYFSAKSVRKMLDRYGFAVNEITHRGKYATCDFILFKARETFGAVVKSFQMIAGLFGFGSSRIYINIYDIMTCVAEKKVKQKTGE